MVQLKAKIISNKRIKSNYWHCVIQAAQVARKAAPGQFINIKLSESLDPFLRRPFSIHSYSGKNLEILYEVIGKGTQALSEKAPGDFIDIIGPLGNGFDCKIKGQAVIVAGGMGVAPLVALAGKISRQKPLVFLGGKSESAILCEKEFKNLGLSVRIATDDGSKGFKGKVTELLKRAINVKASNKPLLIYACGPGPMLKAVASIAKERGILTQLSLEEHMSCGIGACLGCVVETKYGLKRVCKEGPVFNAQDLIWRKGE